MPAISTSAPAKTILFGEHAVVYGHPSIAIPISSLCAKVIIQPSITTNASIAILKNKAGDEEYKISALPENSLTRGAISEFEKAVGQPLPPFIVTISSHIPIAAGLGSSASVAVAIMRALAGFIGMNLSDAEISAIAFQSEKIQHGSPSGIDNSVVSFEKPVFFKKGFPLEFLALGKALHFILADSGERALTKDVVAAVRESRLAKPAKINMLLSKIGDLSTQAKSLIASGNAFALGKLMTENHAHLKDLGVSTITLDKLTESALQSGAFGAKLCGGGRGGFMVAICKAQYQKKITDELEKISPHVISFKLKEEN